MTQALTVCCSLLLLGCGASHPAPTGAGANAGAPVRAPTTTGQPSVATEQPGTMTETPRETTATMESRGEAADPPAPLASAPSAAQDTSGVDSSAALRAEPATAAAPPLPVTVAQPNDTTHLASSAALDPATVRRDILRVIGPLRSCYERALREATSVPLGRVSVLAKTRARGAVRFELQGSTGVRSLDRCLRAAVDGIRLPLDEHPASIRYPFLFDSDGAPRPLSVP